MLLKGKRIFIVEDNAGNLAIASVYLESQGATVKFERRGLKVPESILHLMPIDIVLTDLMLPGHVSGFDVFDQIRQVPELAQIPVVIVSSADPDTMMPMARQKGFAGFIGKPITPRISQQVADVLDGKQVWTADSGALFA